MPWRGFQDSRCAPVLIERVVMGGVCRFLALGERGGRIMEYLIEVQWDDPLADAIGRLLRTMPQGVEQTTSQVPRGPERAFAVYRSDSSESIEGLVGTVSKLGARVRITPMAHVPPVAA
jgi:hypothetical protein